MSLGFTGQRRGPLIKALAAPPSAPTLTRHEDIEVVAPAPAKPRKAKKVKTAPSEASVRVANSAPKAAKAKKRVVVKVHVKNKRLRSLLKLDKKPAA